MSTSRPMNLAAALAVSASGAASNHGKVIRSSVVSMSSRSAPSALRISAALLSTSLRRLSSEACVTPARGSSTQKPRVSACAAIFGASSASLTVNASAVGIAVTGVCVPSCGVSTLSCTASTASSGASSCGNGGISSGVKPCSNSAAASSASSPL